MDDLDEDQPKPRSKRARGSNASSTSSSRSTAANGTAKGSSSSTLTSGTGSSAPVGANDKEQRKQARMIRNRSESRCPLIVQQHERGRIAHHAPLRADAAQASRDRKKEHTQWLETRVQQLEAQLNLAPSSSGFAPSPSASASVVAPTTTGPRSNRSNSISSLASTTPRVAELEEENEVLRVQLHSEQMETARLRGRLESLEDKFSRFEQFMAAPLSTAAVDPLALPPSPSAFIPHTTTPAPFEPTFSFDTIKAEDEDDLTLLPIVAHSSTTVPQVEPSPASPSSMSNSSRLVAREVDLSLPRKLLASPPMIRTTLSRSWSRRPSPRPRLLPLASFTWTTTPSLAPGETGRTGWRSRPRSTRLWRRTTLLPSISTFPTFKMLQ